jgi:hypothetical protein
MPTSLLIFRIGFYFIKIRTLLVFVEMVTEGVSNFSQRQTSAENKVRDTAQR